MKWDDHFYIFGFGLIVIIVAFIMFGQTEGLDFNSIISNFTNEISAIIGDFGISMEVMLVVLFFIGIFIMMKGMTKI